jgi:pimeloyl-ACP methyl ester carboxylesterase
MHTVEGTDPQLYVELHEPAAAAPGPRTTRPVLLIHGFASSTRLNWQDSGWISALTAAGRRVITVDLPGHGRSAALADLDSYTPSRIRADILQLVTDTGARPLKEGDPSSGLDVIGYSLGARLAWEFGATQPELVHRMVLGGASAVDRLAAFDLEAAQQHLADGSPIADPVTADLLRTALLVPGNDTFALMSLVQAVKAEPFLPAEAVPHMPLLFIAGDADEVARSMAELAALSTQSEIVWIPGRNHINAVTARAFKQAAIEFLAVE